MPRCPGQDMRYWTPEDIFDVKCPGCDYSIEFWKDEPVRICKQCGREVRNPRIDLGCAKWCKFAKECLGTLPDLNAAAAPLVDKFTGLLLGAFDKDEQLAKRIEEVRKLASEMISFQDGEPCVVFASVMLIGVGLFGKTIEKTQRQKLMTEAGFDSKTIEAVEKILACVSQGSDCDSKEFCIVRKIISEIKSDS